MRDRLPPILRAMRPSQWVKNVIVGAAPVAAGQLFDGPVIFRAFLAFVAFSMAASATYLYNDASDVEADRVHPVKQHRPIAAGLVTVRRATVTGAILAAAAIALGLVVDLGLGLVLIAYLLLTTAYSLRLKHIAIVDVLAVAAGFTLRAIGGGQAGRVPLSFWFIVVVTTGALLLIVGKRMAEFRAEYGDGDDVTRPVLEQYSFGLLRSLLLVAALSAVVGYSIWASNTAEQPDRVSAAVWLSLVPFALGVMRYTWLSDEGRGETPDRLVFRDPFIVGFGLAWVLWYLVAIYV